MQYIEPEGNGIKRIYIMNTTLSIAFLAGLISFLSPCVLPLIPGYISYISGTSLEKLIEKKNNLVFIKAIFFSLGFTLVFIGFGLTTSFLGKFLLDNSNVLKILAGLIIIFFSLQLIGIINFQFMNRDSRIFSYKKSQSFTFPLIVGAAFGFGWTPCIGPILGSILTLAAIEENLSRAVLLLTFYSLGLAIPFVISAVLVHKFISFSKSFRKYISGVTKVGGFILLLTGIAILTDQLQFLGFFILEYFPTLGNIG